ncbi:putative WD repeat-containing protein C2E1P5.05 [Mycena venus]|uniref:Putative WD repeat-containing protein C2E1P5.05 n=1 Tax=Mycena venus TaxID=2733690 RepID=A0A8H6XMD5_9AGAR|nr:putative WD repeat-containing protein C2E1P5.05 [Mycena venus]
MHSAGQRPPIFALVVGIDEYDRSESYGTLRYACKDADSVSAFLVDSLDVPVENIINLRNSASAKRADILGALKTIQHDPRIIKDDNAILIYFAGHGGRQEAPPGWYSVDGEIEIICPSDMSHSRSIVGIPDRTIAFLINEIAKAKGDNITLILDCCSSAGGNRKARQKHCTARNISNPPTIPADCDADIVGPSGGFRAAGVSARFIGMNYESHILLAACGSQAQAYEMHEYKHGVFTHALLTAFKANHFSELTYTSLMDRLEMPDFQAAHCDGHFPDRRLFDRHSGERDRSLYYGCISAAPDAYTLYAGTAHGITSGMKIAIYKSNVAPASNIQIGVLDVDIADATTSKLIPVPNFHPPSRFYGEAIAGSAEHWLTVFCVDSPWLQNIFRASGRTPQSIHTAIVDTETAADLTVVLDIFGSVAFDRSTNPNSALEEPIAQHTGRRICGALPESDAVGIVAVIESASHFYYHLRRQAPPMESNCEIHMELHSLVDTHGDGALSPAGPNLLAPPGSATLFTPNPMCPMGMTLRNESSRDWYPSVFYFDPSDFTILQWYSPALGTHTAHTYHPLHALQSLTNARNRTRALQIDAPLPSHGTLAIGYGNSGSQPWSFEVRDGEEVEVGFIKAFLTQQPADLRGIAQESVFARKAVKRLLGGKERVPELTMSEWSTEMATIILTRK